VPKWIGAAREFKATGTTRYRDIAANAWANTTGAHRYAIGGNSQAEHFRAANAIAGYLSNDTCEHCNSYNMLKLTRELWLVSPDRPRTVHPAALQGAASQREIGSALFLSINTVKAYNKSLYRKLGVASRQEAVATARVLGLI
jgi:DUF1680 family protein